MRRLKSIPVDKILVPETRVTSFFDDETLQLFKESVKEVGIVQPLLVAFDGQNYILIDGYNRLMEAKAQGMKEVECVVIDADVKQVLLKNLSLNVLRGKVKPTQMLDVVRTLHKEFGMDVDSIARESGLRRDYVEKLLAISELSEDVIAMLDDGLLSVSHAYEISRVKDKDVQERLAAQVVKYRLSVKDLRDVVDKTLEILKARQERREEEKPKAKLEIATTTCDLCDQEWPIKKVRSLNICISCFGIATEAVKARIKELKEEAERARELEKQRIASMLKEVEAA
ncbi:MAG: ParB/RepB/Spo0J family partition protein [Candidatus Nezhaarchaeales archaeon]